MVCSALAAAYSQTTADNIQEIKAAVRTGDHATAVKALQELESAPDVSELRPLLAEVTGELRTLRKQIEASDRPEAVSGSGAEVTYRATVLGAAPWSSHRDSR